MAERATLTDKEYQERLDNYENPANKKPEVKEPEKTPVTKPAAETKPVANPESQPPASEPELTDEQIELILAKRGKKVAAIDEPAQKTEEEKRIERENAKLKFAMENNVFSKSVYDQFLSDKTKGARHIVLEKYLEDNKDSGKNFEQLEKEFSDLYFENVDEDHAYLTERRKKDMEREATSILKRKYPEIHNLDAKFDAHETTQKTNARLQSEKAQKASAAKSAIESVFSSLNKISLSVKEDDQSEEAFDFELPASLLAEVKSNFLSDKVVEQLSDATPEKIKETIEAAIHKVTESQRISFAAKSYHAKKVAGMQLGRKNMNEVAESPMGSEFVQRDEAAYEAVKEFLPAAQKQLEKAGK